MADNQEEKVKSAEQAEQEKLLAIRDIIFGKEIQEYNQEFQELKALIDHNKEESTKAQQDILAKMKAMNQELTSNIESLKKKLSADIDNLSDAKADRRALGAMLEEIGKKLQS